MLRSGRLASGNAKSSTTSPRGGGYSLTLYVAYTGMSCQTVYSFWNCFPEQGILFDVNCSKHGNGCMITVLKYGLYSTQ